MTIATAITAFCDMLHASTGVDTTIGHPSSEQQGIVVWPWRLEENTTARNQFTPGHTNRSTALNVHALVLVRPALTTDGLSQLDAVYQAIEGNAVLASGATHMTVVSAPLSPEVLTSLFLSAAAPLSICVSVLLRVAGEELEEQNTGKVVGIEDRQREQKRLPGKRKLVGKL